MLRRLFQPPPVPHDDELPSERDELPENDDRREELDDPNDRELELPDERERKPPPKLEPERASQRHLMPRSPAPSSFWRNWFRDSNIESLFWPLVHRPARSLLRAT